MNTMKPCAVGEGGDAYLVLNFQHVRAGSPLNSSRVSRKHELTANGPLLPGQPTPLAIISEIPTPEKTDKQTSISSSGVGGR